MNAKARLSISYDFEDEYIDILFDLNRDLSELLVVRLCRMIRTLTGFSYRDILVLRDGNRVEGVRVFLPRD